MTIIRNTAHQNVRKRVQRLDSGHGHHMSPGYGYLYDITPLMEARGEWMTYQYRRLRHALHHRLHQHRDETSP